MEQANIIGKMVSILADIIEFLSTVLCAYCGQHPTAQQRAVFMRRVQVAREGLRQVDNLARQLINPDMSDSSEDD